MTGRPVDPRFAQRMRELLAERGMSYRRLGARIFQAKSHLHAIAHGVKAPMLEMAQRIDDALGAGGELVAYVRHDSVTSESMELARLLCTGQVRDAASDAHGYESAPERGLFGFSAAKLAYTAEAKIDLAGMDTVDQVVLEVGRQHGALLTSDLALGRRASNLGIRWLRTADFVVLCVRIGKVSTDQGIAALRALHSAGRITEALLRDYLEELS